LNSGEMVEKINIDELVKHVDDKTGLNDGEDG
jgi:hypothetical protein